MHYNHYLKEKNNYGNERDEKIMFISFACQNRLTLQTKQNGRKKVIKMLNPWIENCVTLIYPDTMIASRYCILTTTVKIHGEVSLLRYS